MVTRAGQPAIIPCGGLTEAGGIISQLHWSCVLPSLCPAADRTVSQAALFIYLFIYCTMHIFRLSTSGVAILAQCQYSTNTAGKWIKGDIHPQTQQIAIMPYFIVRRRFFLMRYLGAERSQPFRHAVVY